MVSLFIVHMMPYFKIKAKLIESKQLLVLGSTFQSMEKLRQRLNAEYRQDGKTGERCWQCHVTGQSQKGQIFRTVARLLMMYVMETAGLNEQKRTMVDLHS